ncbi:MAG: glycine--tRNA ligase subunit beta [Candidatus Omnitrophota bacterium]
MPKPKKEQKKSIFLLEIGCEELPAIYTKEAVAQLEKFAAKVLSEARLDVEKISSFGTCRRIGFFAEGISLKQKAETEEISGPPKSRAFDGEGQPTEAFYGFLRKTGADKKDIRIRNTDKGEYLYAVKEKPVSSAVKILPSLCKDIITRIQFPKTMRWNDSFSFARPIRWITAFLDDVKINVEIAGIKSGDYTFGHRLFSDKKIKISGAVSYAPAMKKNNILIYSEERKERIIRCLTEAVEKIGAKPDFEANLLEEIVYLTEYPFCFTGEFDKKHLKLPAEVLLASMSKNQKTFALSKEGKITDSFAAVINNKPSDKIKENYKRILEAKLKDAGFFYSRDIKRALEDRNADLEKVIFHKDIGTMAEKVNRLKEMAAYIAKELNLEEKDIEGVARSAWLSKADLTTEMVKEFPSLQGIMGFYYAKKSEETNAVASGIKEHYLPKASGDVLPKTKYGSIVGFVDKFDTIVSCFAVNLISSSSYDPYGLRRNGQGLVRIALASEINVDINTLMDLNIKLLGNKLKKEQVLLKREVTAFLKERIKPFLLEKAKREDLVEAVLNSDFDNFVNISQRVEQIYSIINSKDFFNACKVVERTGNILKPVKEVLPLPDSGLFEEKLENELFNLYENKRKEILNLIARSKYAAATKIYAEAFCDILHVFFDKVLINADNEVVKKNRLALMQAINKLYTQGIADLSYIKSTQEKDEIVLQ